MNLPEIKSIGNIEGKRVFVRVDFNVPIQDGKILDDSRIKKTFETINFLKKKGAIIILASHIESGSLLPVSRHLYHFVPHTFLKGNTSESFEMIKSGKSRQVFLLENLRKNKGEEENNIDFAKELSSLAEIYVNEAFSVSHRKHASIVSIPKFLPSFVGVQFVEEIVNLSQIFHAKSPFLFILGGAKFETKIPLLEKYLNRADSIFVGGALMNDFFRAKGFEIGKSKVSDMQIDLSEEINNPKLMLPTDVVVTDGIDVKITSSDSVSKDQKIVDIGPESISALRNLVKKSKTVLWNGPLGNYEAGFSEGTKETAHVIAEYQRSFSVIGGGDTAVLVNELHLESKFDFVSTGGGAALDFLANETLPGIVAIAKV